MAENWDLSAVVNSTCTPPSKLQSFSENVDYLNPLECLNHLTFGEDDGLNAFGELEPPIISTGLQDDPDSVSDPFWVPRTDHHDVLLEPFPPIPIPDSPVFPSLDQSPFCFQHYQEHQELQNHIHQIFSTITTPTGFISDDFQFQPQFGRDRRSFLGSDHLRFPRQVSPPTPIPRLAAPKPACRRTRNKKSNELDRKVEKVPADKVDSDAWSWRKYGQKPIKGTPYPRNYYKCSGSKGCTARKQVEKSSTDPDVFFVCYAGDHNHSRPEIKKTWHGSRYRFLGRTSFDFPLKKKYRAAPIAPPTPEEGSSYVSSLLSATNLSRATPLSAFKHRVDEAEMGSSVGMNKDVIIIP